MISGVHLNLSIEGVEESIVNTPPVNLQSKNLGKNTNNAKNEVRFKRLIRDL
jgi:hypothetical protein